MFFTFEIVFSNQLRFANVLACFIIYLEVLQLDLQVPFMVHVLFGQENSMAVVAGLPKNLDGNLHIKVDLTVTTLLKKITERQWCQHMIWQLLAH